MVTFEEDTAFRKSKKDKEDEEEHETPRAAEGPKPIRNEEEEHIPEDHYITEPQRRKEFPTIPLETILQKRCLEEKILKLVT